MRMHVSAAVLLLVLVLTPMVAAASSAEIVQLAKEIEVLMDGLLTDPRIQASSQNTSRVEKARSNALLIQADPMAKSVVNRAQRIENGLMQVCDRYFGMTGSVCGSNRPVWTGYIGPAVQKAQEIRVLALAR